MKHLIYGVLGTGSGEPRIIEDSLADLKDFDRIAIIGKRRSNETEKVIYNWLLDNQVEYVLLADMYAPKVLHDYATEIVESNGEHTTDMLDYLEENKGALLLLWDDSEATTQIVQNASDRNIPVYELNNGLVPVEAKIEKVKDMEAKPVQVDEVEVEPFTKEELLEMPINVLKRQIKALGFNTAPTDTKVELVDRIVGVQQVDEEPKTKSTNAVAVFFGQDGAINKTLVLTDEDIKYLLSTRR
jgi:hypothetical protein